MRVLVAGEYSGAVRDAFLTRGYDAMSPSPDRWRERSRTYAGIAAAMADQWGTA